MNIQLYPKNSLIGHFYKTFFFVYFVSSLIMFSIVISNNIDSNQAFEITNTESQIKLILNELEAYRLADNYSFVCKKINNLNKVVAIVITEKNKILCKSPISLNIDKKFIRLDYKDNLHKIDKIQYTLLQDNIKVYQDTLPVLLIQIVFLLVLFFLIRTILNKRLKAPIEELNSQLADFYFKEEYIFQDKQLPLEFANTFKILKDAKKQLKNKQDEIKKLKEEEVTSLITKQVAHDIRSPLAALDMVTKDMQNIPEDKRIMIRASVARIHDIANDLLIKNKNNETNDSSDSKELTSIMLSDIISSLITEKRIQFRNQVGITIENNINEQSFGLFAKVNVTEFSRLISNIINNAREAFEDHKGIIKIELHGNPENTKQIQIKIMDNGKGIPKILIEKLGVKGNTFGKIKGSGLGLYHAKTTIESWNGYLLINSEENKGTEILINLPKDGLPKTFVSSLELDSSHNIVILDDDQSIHQIWKGRFESASNSKGRPKLIHFTDPDKFKYWYQNNKKEIDLYLIDYEYIGHKTNGIKIISDNKINSKAILVTSRYTEENVRCQCENLNIKLLPKGLAVFVKINISDDPIKKIKKVEKSIFLDDDFIIRLGWESAAKDHGIDLDTYENPNDLMKNIESYNKESIFYIDSSLGDKIKGEEFAKELFKLGFKNLYLATGYEKDHFKNIDHIKDVLPKEAPWG